MNRIIFDVLCFNNKRRIPSVKKVQKYMSIYVFSDTLKSLEPKCFSSSSEKYEYSISKELSKHELVIIFSKATDKEYISGSLMLLPFSASVIKEIIKPCRENINNVAIFLGYDLRNVLRMLALRNKYRLKTFPYVFDSHSEAIKKYGRLKRFIANVYFYLGKRLIRRFDGLILFQEKAAQKLHFKKEYYVTKPGITTEMDVKCKKTSPFFVTFAGSFTELNGVDVLLKAFSSLNITDMYLNLYGYGLLKESVERYAAEYSNIHYCGVVDEQHLLRVYEESNVLLNLRVLNSECMDYAFPSKIIEILASGVPVISSDVFDDRTMKTMFCNVDEITSDKIQEALKTVYDNYDYYLEKAKEAKEYISSHYNYEILGKGLYEYISRNR